jgi:murein L,D-transpeptidase YafK
MNLSASCLLSVAFLASGVPAPQSSTVVPSSDRSVRAEREASARLAPVLNERSLELGAPVCLRVFKEERELEVWMRGRTGEYRLVKTYAVCLVSGGLGPKLKEGDRQGPEGFYSVPPAAMNPSSAYHVGFDLGYPNEYDRALGRTGSELMIHGECMSIGCYAMTNPPIEEIWTCMAAAFRKGQPETQVQMYPFRMTRDAMRRHRDDRWYDFWTNLKEGYDLFEKTKTPPRVEVRDGRYRFSAARAGRPVDQ